MQKLTESTIKNNNSTSQTTNAKPQPSPEEIREEKICYYRDLFRLDFRVYDEEDDEKDDEEDYVDDTGYFERGKLFSFDDEDVIWYQKKFESLDALNVFYNLCMEYCQETLRVLRKNMAKYPLLTNLSAKEFAERKNRKNKSPDGKQQEHHLRKLIKEEMDKTEMNQRAQAEIKKQIAIITSKTNLLNVPRCIENANKFVARAIVKMPAPMPEMIR